MKIITRIDQNQLAQFLELSHDDNPLHRQEPPLIPGNLLVALFEKIYQNHFNKPIFSISIQFCSPAYMNEELMFEVFSSTFTIKDKKNNVIAHGEWINE